MRCKDDSGLTKAMEIVKSDCSDLEKMKALKLNKLDTRDKPDIFDGLFKDHSIDIRTGELLGRYIAEERGTLRLLQGCCAELTANATGARRVPRTTIGSFRSKTSSTRCVRGVEELRQIVCAQTMPAASA